MTLDLFCSCAPSALKCSIPRPFVTIHKMQSLREKLQAEAALGVRFWRGSLQRVFRGSVIFLGARNADGGDTTTKFVNLDRWILLSKPRKRPATLIRDPVPFCGKLRMGHLFRWRG